MKINTGSPRIPLDRLKHPLKQSSPLAGIREGIEAEESSVFSETFERDILQTKKEMVRLILLKQGITNHWC